jgi:hypothetical protein
MRELDTRPFSLSISAISFLDHGSSWGGPAGAEDLSGSTWLWRIPPRRWLTSLRSPWDLVLPDGAALLIPQALNDDELLKQLRTIILDTSPSEPDSRAL